MLRIFHESYWVFWFCKMTKRLLLNIRTNIISIFEINVGKIRRGRKVFYSWREKEIWSRNYIESGMDHFVIAEESMVAPLWSGTSEWQKQLSPFVRDTLIFVLASFQPLEVILDSTSERLHSQRPFSIQFINLWTAILSISLFLFSFVH